MEQESCELSNTPKVDDQSVGEPSEDKQCEKIDAGGKQQKKKEKKTWMRKKVDVREASK